MELPRENVQSYPRPPALEPVAAVLRVVFGGAEIVRSTAGYRVLETHHAPTYYIPPEDVPDGVLLPVAGASRCEWKGRARYFDVAAGGEAARRAAWAYPAPTQRFEAIRDYVAFYPAAMDACFVGDARVRPQPGDFYGGWVTDNLDGIVKGGPGTLHW
ncbi:MAG: DUF427 domain-containing protein [Paracoccaceae bacterium]|nr:DUF427 domain-containing protein [Paracoccaceae bacterium]